MAMDDTTAGRCGRHVAHGGWFKDASGGGCSHKAPGRQKRSKKRTMSSEEKSE
ncbi:MAG TPA: hypothetical protein VMW16_09810 [Sedimentisphaerales bacterium]|nr:hypothetical protein [Sedimentisphaerales bacterium]